MWNALSELFKCLQVSINIPAKALTAIFFRTDDMESHRPGVRYPEERNPPGKNEYYTKLFPKDAKYDQEGSALPSELITSGKSVTRMVLGCTRTGLHRPHISIMTMMFCHI